MEMYTASARHCDDLLQQEGTSSLVRWVRGWLLGTRKNQAPAQIYPLVIGNYLMT